MALRKQRLIQDLYNATRTLSQPKVTPVLRGNYQMQGPVDDANCDINTNMVPPHVDEEYNSYSKNFKSGLGAESGNCNVCSAPCSSCLHINQRLMGSKIDECSGETCNESALSFSVNDAIQNDDIKKCETDQKSNIRNVVNGNSSNTSENVDCEASLKNSGISTTSDNVVIPKFDDPEGEEGSDHYVSGDMGTKETKLPNFNVRDVDRTELPNYPASDSCLTPQENGKEVSHLDMECFLENQNNLGREIRNSEESLEQVPLSMCSQTDASLQKLGSAGGSSINAGDTTPLLKAPDDLSHPPCGKSLFSDSSSKDFQENLCPRFEGGLLEYPSKNLNSLSMKRVISGMVNGDPAVDSLDYEEKDEGVNKNVGSGPLPGAKGNALESNSTDESDDSDMVEHDVKVCDICGDAGRDELLAICCRCSDGAEHTYCMREMLDKVPEGYWLCEECKADAETKNQKEDTVSTVGLDEGIYSSGQANPENSNFSMKSEAKGSDVEGNRSSKDASGVKISGKRHIEDAEVSSAAKKHALDHIVDPTKMLAANILPALSRDSSFKHLDSRNTRPPQQSSSFTISAPESADLPASTSLLQTPQGTFIKSNSFNSLNKKPKVKLVDDVVPQKPRSVRDPASINKKEGAARPIGKSMSFKFANSSRLNSSESKVNILSPKFSPGQDIKGSKHTKDRSLFEKKNSLNKERPSVSSPMASSGVFAAKQDKKLASCGGPNLVASVRSYCDTKAVQSDSQSVTLSRSSSFVARKASEMPISFGDSKRQSSQLTSSIGVSSTNETSSHDLKRNLSSLKEDSSSSSCVAERPPCNTKEGLQDGLSRPRESTNFGERGKESSVSHSKQSSTIGGRTVSCHKSKEFGHLASTADCPGSPASDASAVKDSREMMDCKDKLKTAIEAAVLRRPGIYRKHRVTDQSDDVSLSSLNCEIAFQNHVMNSSNRGNMSTAEDPEGHMIKGNSTADSCKQATVNNLKQLAASHVEASSLRTGNACPVIPSEGLFRKDKLGYDPATMPLLLKTLAIPDHNYIWQGFFEVRRSGKNRNLCDGVQAHLSSCASPKVLEAVNKFPRKVLLNEVPRLSTWPVQFQEYGVKEDNIALFFFAKDLSSYEKSYKILLDNMMKNDVALKGNLNDVELMIFPSNQLPDKAQRWNTLFFLWGVFRGKRSDCSEHVPSSRKQIFVPQDIPTAILSSHENISSGRPVDRDFPERRDPASAAEVPASKELPCLSFAQTWNGDCDTRLSSHVLPNYHTKPIMEKQDNMPDSSCFSMVQCSSWKSCEEAEDTNISCEDLTHTNPSLDVCIEPDDKLEPEPHPPAEANRTVGYNKSKQMSMHRDFNLSGHLSLHGFDESPADECGRASIRSMDESNISDNMSNSRRQEDLTDGSMHETPCSTIDQIVKDNYWKCQHVDSMVRISQAACTSTSQVTTWNSPSDILVEEFRTCKKQRTDFHAFNGGNDLANSPIEGFMPRIHGLASDSPIRANGHNEASNRSDVLMLERNAERYLFPLDAHTDVGWDGKSSPWRIDPFEENRFPDRAPNLELALGAETRASSLGIPPFLVGKEDKKSIQDHCLHDATTKGEDDDDSDLSASLSLSLSFPFPDEEQTLKSVAEAEQRHVNTSLLLFGGLRNK